jgi:hypothetical protein
VGEEISVSNPTAGIAAITEYTEVGGLIIGPKEMVAT